MTFFVRAVLSGEEQRHAAERAAKWPDGLPPFPTRRARLAGPHRATAPSALTPWLYTPRRQVLLPLWTAEPTVGAPPGLACLRPEAVAPVPECSRAELHETTQGHGGAR